MSKSSSKMSGKACLQGPTNLNAVKPSNSGTKMTKPHRIKARSPKGGGR